MSCMLPAALLTLDTSHVTKPRDVYTFVLSRRTGHVYDSVRNS
jgi:hypothetical protein